MKYKVEHIKEGIKVHLIETSKFKTNLMAIFITVPLTRVNVTKDTLINLILHRGSETLKTQDQISKELEKLYGAIFDFGIEKNGDNHVLKFYIQSLNDKYIENDNYVLKNGLKILTDIIFNPVTEKGEFKREYFESEKEKLRRIISAKIDNKDAYAVNRCIEEMYKEKTYGLYKYGYKGDIDYIQNTDLFERYEQIINTGKIDIFLSGNVGDEAIDLIKQDVNIKKLKGRNPKFKASDGRNELVRNSQIREVQDSMQVAQGKIVMGLNIGENKDSTHYVALLYNMMLGGSANSRLFQNVREKQSLAYTASSMYIKSKNNILIKCGIDINNYYKTIDTIKEQLEDLKNGNFSEEEINNAKITLTSSIKGMADEQDSLITYYFGQELSYEKINLIQYAKKIGEITRQDIINLANKTYIDTIYFLKD